MQIEIIYEYNDGNIYKYNKIYVKDNPINMREIIDQFKSSDKINPKCWIFHIPTMSWILCPNDIVLNHTNPSKNN